MKKALSLPKFFILGGLALLLAIIFSNLNRYGSSDDKAQRYEGLFGVEKASADMIVACGSGCMASVACGSGSSSSCACSCA